MKLNKYFYTSLILLLLLPFLLLAQGSSTPVWSAKTTLPRIALTFDDGPKPEHSPQILEVLDRFGVRATFFVVGREAYWHPDLIYRIFTSGHEIANHSYSHCCLDTLTDKQLELELAATNDIIKSITGVKPHFLRPPGGRYNHLVLNSAAKHKLKIVMYDVNAGDYTRSSPVFTINGEYKKGNGKYYYKPANQIVADVVSNTKNGSILLFHNGGEQTINALPEVITELRKKGFQMVTLSELLAPDSALAFFNLKNKIPTQNQRPVL